MYPVSILCLKVYPIQQCVRLHPWAMLLTVGKSRGHVCYPEDTPVMKDSMPGSRLSQRATLGPHQTHRMGPREPPPPSQLGGPILYKEPPLTLRVKH